MEAIGNWTQEYFLSNQAACLQKLQQELSFEEKVSLRSNLQFKESGRLVLVNHCFITDIRETELYSYKYKVTRRSDGSTRMVDGKYSDRIILSEDEFCDNPAKYLEERQLCILTKSDTNNAWIKEFESSSVNANKRKIDHESEQSSFLVKVYDNTEIILNDLVEIIGFLHPTPQYSNNEMENNDFNEELPNLPAYSIHSVVYKRQPHNNPLLIIPTDGEMAPEVIQKELLNVFSQILFGDQLSAHYLLCHLVSNVYSRVNDEALGKFTLNLICQPLPAEVLREYSRVIYSLFETLMPNSLYFEMTIENLNTLNFVPRKDYKENKLNTGLLQLPKGTHILMDETMLENGNLDNAGCKALTNFTELIRSQQLSYDFQFYQIPYKTDIPILIISEGKSLLPSDFALPLMVTDLKSAGLIHENLAAAMHYMRPKLNTYRRFLTKCRLQKFEIGQEQTKMVEADFIKLRENSNFNIENLHGLLVISRLMGISMGHTSLDISSWEIAKHMESERISRMNKRNAKQEP